jgi:hypothetical protein
MVGEKMPRPTKCLTVLLQDVPLDGELFRPDDRKPPQGSRTHPFRGARALHTSSRMRARHLVFLMLRIATETSLPHIVFLAPLNTKKGESLWTPI